MTKYHLDDMIKGWFVGNFEPTVFSTEACEVSIKKFLKDEHEEKHFHKVATEITVIISGSARMGEGVYSEGDIIKIEPGTAVDFLALTDVILAAVKIPGAKSDKYLSSEQAG